MRDYIVRQWRAFWPHLKATPLRFPLSFACALVFAATLVLSIHEFRYLTDEDLVGRILWFCVIGFFLLLAVQLLGEARGWSGVAVLAVSAVAVGLLAWRIATADIGVFWSSGITLFLAPASLLAVMAAPFAQSRQNDLALWQFNRAAWFSGAFALLVGLVLAGGISSAFWALDELFGLDVPDELFADVWALALGLLTPWLLLAGVPGGFAGGEETEEAAMPPPLAFLATYILVPLAVAYFAILYAFMVKIAVLWDLPRGEVATLIMGYAAFGVAVHLIAYPLRESGAAHLRLFHRWFYPALIVPAALLALAIGVRVEAYGVTEDRYLVMTFALWLLLLAPFMTLRPRTGLKVVPLSLAALLALGSFGPWGAESVSLKSQMARLENLLVANGLLKGGRIVPSEGDVPRADNRQISSIVAYLRDTERHQTLAPWFQDSDLDLSSDPYAPKIVEAMGLPFVLYEGAMPGFHFYVQPNAVLSDIRGFDRIGRVQLYAYNPQHEWQATLGGGDGSGAYELGFAASEGKLLVSGPDRGRVEVDLAAFVERLREQGANRAVEDFELEASGEGLRVRLLFQDLNGILDGNQVQVHSANFFLLIGRAGP